MNLPTTWVPEATDPASGDRPAGWVPDYLHGSLRHWRAPSTCQRRHRCCPAGQVIHCVGRIQHLLDVLFGRIPRSRCGILLVQATPTALLEDGAPLCPACVALAHPPASEVEAFNQRGVSTGHVQQGRR